MYPITLAVSSPQYCDLDDKVVKHLRWGASEAVRNHGASLTFRESDAHANQDEDACKRSVTVFRRFSSKPF